MTKIHSAAATAGDELGDLQRAHEAVVSLFDLLSDDISGPEWLARMARFARCATARCLWWPLGRPEFYREECSGPATPLGAASLLHLDALIQERPRTAAAFVDDWAAGSEQQSLLDGAVLRPDRLVICLDWLPAPVLLLFEGRDGNAAWDTHDRQRLTRLLPVLHKSVAIKKRLSWNADIADLANKVFDDIPRGFIAMMPNRKVVLADQVARDLIDTGELLRLVDGKLELRDSRVHGELVTTLQTIEKLPKTALPRFAWRKNLSGNAGPNSYLAVTKGFEFDSWRSESTPYSRVAVMVLQNQQLAEHVDEQMLQEYFGLTRAQARVVVALADGQSAEAAATKLSISVNTVRSHLRSIYAQLNVENKSQMLQRVMSGSSGPNNSR